MASELEVQTIRGPSGGANADTVLIPSGQTLHAPGHVIQTVYDQFSTTYSTSTNSMTSFRTLYITPKFATSKILVMANFFVRVTSSAGYGFADFDAYRGSTLIWNGYPSMGSTDGGNDTRGSVYFQRIDEPNTSSSISYDFRFSAEYTNQTVYVNSTTNPSSIVLQEIAQ